MLELSQIQSLTSFTRNTRQHVRRLKKTGKPEVLTVNGQAELVVQSADSYQRMLGDLELAHSLRVIRKSLKEAQAGKGRPMRDFVEELAKKYAIDLEP